MGFTFGSYLRVVGTKLHRPFRGVIDDVKRSDDAAKFLKRSIVGPFTHRKAQESWLNIGTLQRVQ